MRAPIVLAGPPTERTRLARDYEVKILDLHGIVTRVVRARSPEEALLDVHLGLEQIERVDLTAMPATVRRLKDGETWMSPGSPSSS